MQNDSDLQHGKSVIALIRHCREGDHPAWLLVADPRRPGLRWIHARQLGNESPRESIAREIAWQLGLDRNRDFLVSSMARLNLEPGGPWLDQLPADLQDSQGLVFLTVEIYREEALEKLRQNSRCLWLEPERILAGHSSCGIAVQPAWARLIGQTGVIQAENSGPLEG